MDDFTRNASPRIIAIGASSGGVDAIFKLAASLEPDFPVPILFTQHMGSYPSELWRFVSARGANAAVHPTDGEIPQAGKIYIAPPDHHMLFEGGALRLHRGPKEHHARPAIDPMFRSVALSCGDNAIGVVLTGMLDDGAAGLKAIKECGGIAVVQDPADAEAPSMPISALEAVDADHVVALDALGPLLGKLARSAPKKGSPMEQEKWRREDLRGLSGQAMMENLQAIGSLSSFTCPDCGGSLFELNDNRPVRYRCHTGHAFSLRSLASLQEELIDSAVWTSVRALQESEAVFRRLAADGASAFAQDSAKALHSANRLAELSQN